MHYKKPFFSMDSEEVKVQLAPFAVSAIQKRKRPCRLRDRVLNLSSLFFSLFHHLRQLLLQSLVIKCKNLFSSKIKFRKSYWISNKNNNVTLCDRLIFYYSI